MQATQRKAASWALALAVAATSASRASGSPAAVGRWRYDVTLVPAMDRLVIDLAFDEYRPRVLVAGDHDARKTIFAPRLARTGEALAASPGGGWIAPDLVAGDVLRYEVALAKLNAPDAWTPRSGEVPLQGLVATEALLLRPALLPGDVDVTLQLHLPEGASASFPWPECAGTFHLRRNAFERRGLVALGDLDARRVWSSGAQFDVDVVSVPRRVTPAGLERWIADSADAVRGIYGRFPAERVQVFVETIEGDEPVPFGMTLWGGGPSVLLILGAAATDADLASDGTATHEFLHLGMPWLRREDDWMAEGFVTYFTEIARARSGLQTEREAWRRLADGFARGRAAAGRGALAQEELRPDGERTCARVYWGGAAAALRLDVELRRASRGRLSLASAMRELNEMARGRPFVQSGADVLLRLDGWCGRPIFTSVARETLAEERVSDLAPMLEELGVRAAADGVVLSDAASGTELRRAIFR